jgi:hypothetical protein
MTFLVAGRGLWAADRVGLLRRLPSDFLSWRRQPKLASLKQGLPSSANPAKSSAPQTSTQRPLPAPRKDEWSKQKTSHKRPVFLSKFNRFSIDSLRGFTQLSQIKRLYSTQLNKAASLNSVK